VFSPGEKKLVRNGYGSKMGNYPNNPPTQPTARGRASEKRLHAASVDEQLKVESKLQEQARHRKEKASCKMQKESKLQEQARTMEKMQAQEASKQDARRKQAAKASKVWKKKASCKSKKRASKKKKKKKQASVDEQLTASSKSKTTHGRSKRWRLSVAGRLLEAWDMHFAAGLLLVPKAMFGCLAAEF